MKTRLLLLICGMLAGWINLLPAQTVKCYDFTCMMKNARWYLEKDEFQNAINTAIAAKHYSGADVEMADALIKEIFVEIENLRVKAEQDREAAENATRKAKALAEIARMEKTQAEIARVEADSQRNAAIQARAEVQFWVNKGQTLENTFPGSAYNYLYQTGLRHFQWDETAQRRDYQNALTYFALARFLQPSDTLGYLVQAADLGVYAEQDFLNGQLDSARSKYAQIQLYINQTTHPADFELRRMEQIRQVEDLYQTFNQKLHNDTILLRGDWWTIPADFSRRYPDVSAITFENVPATLQQFPTALGGLARLHNLSLINCKEIRSLEDWSQLPRLQALTLKDLPNLYDLRQSTQSSQLTYLDVTNCPAFTHITGCNKLETVSIEQSPQVRIESLLDTNPSLKKLELADLPGDSLNVAKLPNLETLRLARLKIRSLTGIEGNSQLKILRIDQLNQLTVLNPPAGLHAVYIANCAKLEALDAWPQSDSLKTMVLLDNNRLEKLPNWQHTTGLNDLLVMNNKNITSRIHGTQVLKHTDRLYLINNSNVVTNSLHAGFGYDWGFYPSSVKLEFEHRRTIWWLKNADIGLKFVGAYAWKRFQNENLFGQQRAEGFLGGFIGNYYSPYRIFAGIGLGLGNMHYQGFGQGQGMDGIKFVWINNLGIIIPFYYPKKDRISLNMDLYTIFDDFWKGDYYILPSFGLTYHYTFGFRKGTQFIRPSDARRHVVRKWRIFGKSEKVRMYSVPGQF